jgi:tellurite resistance protein TehA-like permease
MTHVSTRDYSGGKELIPVQFAVTMGTGIVSILLHALSDLYPRYHSSLRHLSIIFFVLNIAIFTVILAISMLRYMLYPATWSLMLRHSVQSLFLGTLPMGFATIVNMFAAICVPAWGGATPYVAWAMWWVDVVASVACCLWLLFQMHVSIKVYSVLQKLNSGQDDHPQEPP